MARLTDQQQKALDTHATSVVLSAGAGCGKTTVLTERFVTALAIEGGVSLDRIVALTFTDKAASELRHRVRLACRVKLEEGDDPDYWRGVLRGLEAAPIGTFHTFCGGIVRQYAVRAGVDPGFTILDESIASTYRESAVDRALRLGLREGNADLRELAVEHGLDSVRETLVRLMADRSAPGFDDWSRRTPDQLISLWRNEFTAKGIPAVLRRLHRDLDPCLKLLESYDCRHHPEMRRRHTVLISAIHDLLPSTDPQSLIESIQEHAKVQSGGVAKQWPTIELYELFKKTLEEVRTKHVKKALDSFNHDETNTLVSADHGIRFARLAARSWSHYEAVKLERGALDFNDLLFKTRDLLGDDSISVRADLTARYDLILVDEFQDTDPVQDEIIRRIGGDDLASGRLFLVGDFKQSIYGFRGARPDLFANYRQEFPVEGQLPLTENFRSRPAILHFVNALFADAFSDPYEPLTPGRPDLLPEDQGAVVFAWPDPRDDPDAKDDRDTDRKRQEEAARLTRMIRILIDDGYPVHDKSTGKVRPIHPGDIAFLFRANSAFVPYEQALDAEGLDYYLIGGPAYYAQQEVQDLIHVLTVIDNPHDSLALAGALRSPFFALSDEALFWLSTVRVGDLSAGLARCDEATLPDLSDRDRKHALRAQNWLTRWRASKECEPIAALVARVIEESGFEVALLGEPLGDRKRANARKLVRIARKFDAEGGLTLADFVARLRADLKEPPQEEQAGTTDETGQAVRLLTIHKAKGLEFPVVVMPDIDRRPGAPHKHIVFDEQLGPLVNAKSESTDDEADRDESAASLGWLVDRLLRSEEDRAESLRVFYVATTRARDLLVLSSCGDPTGKPQSAPMELLKERFDIMTGTRLASVPDDAPPARVEVVVGTPTAGSRPVKNVRRRPPVRAIARLIERHSGPREQSAAKHLVRRIPTYLNLDPSATLSPSAARIDRLVRSVLLDPRSFRGVTLDEAAVDLTLRQRPAATPRMTAEAVGRIRHWLLGSLGREIASAREVVRDIAWSVARRTEDGSEIVIEGRIDLAYRDSQGAWRLVQVSDVGASDSAQRLRLALSTSLATPLGCGPIEQAWWIRHGSGGGLHSEAPAGETAIAALLAAMEVEV